MNIPVKKNKGQVTVEYILLISAVLAIVIIFLGPGTNGRNGPFRRILQETMAPWPEGLRNLANRMSTSRPPG